MKYIVYFFLLFSLAIFSQKKFPIGKIINKVVVKNSSKETFELYLPSKYQSKEKNAIIFIFDPSGIGKYGINTFVSAAEEFNYVLVCSNNTKNGPYQENFNITNRLFEHVFSEFNIDTKQIYTAGFSGGSRLASAIAVLTNSIQGVIGCGAGFAINANVTPSIQNKFSYVGLVGDEDMNYQEMLDLNLWLNKLKVNNELFTYDDGHKWPKENQIKRALGWLELQSYKRNLRKIDYSIINNLYNVNYFEAKKIEKSQPYNSVVEYKRILKNFYGFYNLDSISKQISIIKKTKEFKNELKIRKTIKSEESKISKLLLNKFREEVVLFKSKNEFKWWKKELKKLDKKVNKSKNIFTKKMIKRVRYKIMANAVEGSNTYLRNKDIKSAFYCDQLLTILEPKKPYWYFRLGQSYARKNKYSQVILNLEKAIELGFKNKNALINVKEFSSYQENKKFISLVNSIKN